MYMPHAACTCISAGPEIHFGGPVYIDEHNFGRETWLEVHPIDDLSIVSKTVNASKGQIMVPKPHNAVSAALPGHFIVTARPDESAPVVVTHVGAGHVYRFCNPHDTYRVLVKMKDANGKDHPQMASYYAYPQSCVDIVMTADDLRVHLILEEGVPVGTKVMVSYELAY
jgi:hypothetical protein